MNLCLLGNVHLFLFDKHECRKTWFKITRYASCDLFSAGHVCHECSFTQKNLYSMHDFIFITKKIVHIYFFPHDQLG